MRPCGPTDQIHADDEDAASSAFQHALSKFEEIVHAWSAEGCALAALPSQLRRLKCDASTAATKGVEAQDEPQCAVAASQADISSAARLFTHRGTSLFYTALPDETCRHIRLAMNGRNKSHLCSCNQPRQTILSLDGGGIRGYGSLFILEELMRECQIFEEKLDFKDGIVPDSPGTGMPLPCKYFDYVAGTSTGGLIAIMVGRLRMSVASAKEQYAKLGKEVFSGRRWWRSSKYDHRPLESAVKTVVRDFHGTEDRHGEHTLLEHKSIGARTSRTLLYALRKKGNEDVPYVFRSYEREGFVNKSTPLFDRKHRNAHDNINILIWQAARATSAAPTYFKTQKVDEYDFMDGGIETNNPSHEAWFEVQGVHELRCTEDCYKDTEGTHVHNPCQEPAGGVKILVSIGTGRGDKKAIFKTRGRVLQIISLLRRGMGALTDPENTHHTTRDIAAKVGVNYFRLNVTTGLEDVEMDAADRMEYIKATTTTFFERRDDRKLLKDCAEMLVRHRRAICTTHNRRSHNGSHHMNGNTFGGSHRSRHMPNGTIHEREEQAVSGASELGPQSPNGHVLPPFSEAGSQPLLELRTSNSWHYSTPDSRSPQRHRHGRSDDSVPMSARSEGPVEMPERRDPHELPNSYR